MIAQTSLFDDIELASVEDQICHMLNQLIAENGLEGLTVSVSKLKSSASSAKHSIALLDSLIVRIFIGKKKKYLELPDIKKPIKCKKLVKIDLADLREIPDHYDRIADVCQYRLDGALKEFSCCSQYMACSDAKICTNADKLEALGCYYRRVLHSGRIFYGKNRNVD